MTTTPPSTTDDPTEVDGVREADAEQTHPLLTAALLALLLSTHGPEAPSIHRAWYGLVESTVGATVASYLTRSALDMLDALPGARPSSHPALAEPAIRQTAEAVRRQVARQLAESTRLLAGADNRRHDSAVSAARIAYSVTTGGREQLRDQVARDIGATARIWRTRHDDRVRSTHAHLDGQVRQFDRPFDVADGLTIRFPGDPDAPLSLTAGCRCHTAYRVPRLA